jgi:hypothetical protein
MSEGNESRELTYMEAHRTARGSFHRALIAHAENQLSETKPGAELTKADLEILKSYNVYSIAEFYFAASEYGLVKDELELRSYIDRHNQKIRHLIEDERSRRAAGITATAAEECLIGTASTENIINATRLFGKGEYIVLNQTCLGSLLIDFMSRESCRKCIVKLEQFGLIGRIFMLGTNIDTCGILEGYIKNSLRLACDYLGAQTMTTSVTNGDPQ